MMSSDVLALSSKDEAPVVVGNLRRQRTHGKGKATCLGDVSLRKLHTNISKVVKAKGEMRAKKRKVDSRDQDVSQSSSCLCTFLIPILLFKLFIFNYQVVIGLVSVEKSLTITCYFSSFGSVCAEAELKTCFSQVRPNSIW